MDMLAKIHGKDSSMQTLTAEIKEHADALAVLESDLARLVELQDIDPERSMEMDGRIYVGGMPMRICAEIPIAELIESKRREIDRALGVFNRTSVAMNEASVRLNGFVPESLRPHVPMPKVETPIEEPNPAPSAPQAPETPPGGLVREEAFTFTDVDGEPAVARRTDVKAELQKPLVGGFRGFRKG